MWTYNRKAAEEHEAIIRVAVIQRVFIQRALECRGEEGNRAGEQEEKVSTHTE